MGSAIRGAQVSSAQIDWIQASGAGSKDQDASEITAIRAVVRGIIPLVTSTEAYFGHYNGAGPAIGLVSAIEAQRQGWEPSTLNFNYNTVAFPGIDFVLNVARKKTRMCFYPRQQPLV